MKIHLNRSGQSLGQFMPDEVREGYRDGRFQSSDLAWRDGMSMWRPLGEVIDEIAPDDGTSSAPSLPPSQDGPAWEQRADKGVFGALLDTVRSVLLEPSATFSTMRQTGGLWSPLLFFMLLGSIAFLASLFYEFVWQSLGLAAADEQKTEALQLVFGSALVMVMLVFLAPLIVALSAFLGAGITHLFLILVGGAKRPFEATFRVVCYAAGSTAILQLLPICGAWIASIWVLVAEIIGLSEVHGITRARAAVAVLLPMVLCCGLIVAFFVVVFGAAVASGAIPTK